MEKKLCKFDNYNECIICFDNITSEYNTKCKLCGVICHNHCWETWILKSGKKKKCVHCGQQKCIKTKKYTWYNKLFNCVIIFLKQKK